MSGPLASDQAIDLLHKNPAAYTTPDQIRTLAARVDANATGRLTVLYSGGVGKGVWSTDVIEGMKAAGEDVRIIDKSEAAKFMKSEDFYRAVAKAHGLPDSRQLENGKYRGPASDWLYHPTQGPWADASARFAELTKGEVRAVVSGAAPDRVFGAVELPRVIANPQVTTIEGIPRQTLAKVVAEKGLQPAFEMMVAKSHENVGTLRAAVNASGMPIKENGALLLDSRAYLHGTPAQAKTPISTAVARSMGDLMGPPNATASTGQAHLQTWQAQIALDAGVQPVRPAAGQRGAAILGTAAAAAAVGYDILTTGQKTIHLLNQGNLTGAQSEVLHFGGRNGGMVAGAALGAYVGGAVASVPGTVVGGAAGLIGGAIVGDKIMDALDQSRIYNQRGSDGSDGSDGNDWNLDPSQPEQGWTRLPRPGEFGPQGPPEGAGYKNHLLHAAPRLADELNYKASSIAVEAALAHPRAPQDPFRQEPESIGETVRPGIGAGQPWLRDPQSHAWTRQATEAPTPMTHGMPVQRTVTASPEQGRQLDAAAQRVIADNIAYSPQAIAQRYLEAYSQHGWKQHGPVPAVVTHAAQGHVREERDATRQQMPAPPQPASGHLTPQQIERITTHESRIVPTPGGMSFAEAHRRRDEPEQISAGSLRPVGKLDEIHRTQGGPLYRVHQAQEQALMRDLGIALAQDRERFKNEPSPQRTLQPSVERTQERVQEQAAAQKQAETRQAAPPAPSRGEHAVAPVAQAHVSPARPAAGAEAMHLPTTQVSTHAPMAAPVHSNPQGDAAAIAAAQAQAAAAQAQAVAAQAELAATRQQMARMAAERGHDDLARRDERDERDQRDQAGTRQIAQGRDSRQELEAGTHGKQISATAAADTSRPLLRDFSDPSHPQNALYSTLKDLLPKGTSEERLAQGTAACHRSRITEKDLSGIYIGDTSVVFASRSLFAVPAQMDISQPAPSVQQSDQHILQTDQQRAQIMSEIRTQNAAQANQQQVPVMG